MDRKALREFTHKAGSFLSVKNDNYKQWIFRYTFLELEKDLAPGGDVTTKAIFHEDRIVRARIIAKGAGIFAGLEEIRYFLVEADPKFRPSIRGEFKVDFKVGDGDAFVVGDVLLEIEAEVHDLLAVERVVLNLLMRMSGIATFTRTIVDMVEGCDVLITPTRKTLWGLLDKRAVLVGGGGSHRLNLSDAILVKDTHLDLMGGDVGKILEKIAAFGGDYRFIELELESADLALTAAELLTKYLDEKKIRSMGAILLDNMSAAEVRDVMAEMVRRGLKDGLLFECSGGINEENVLEYAQTGVDIVSMGCLTSGIKGVDMSLKVV